MPGEPPRPELPPSPRIPPFDIQLRSPRFAPPAVSPLQPDRQARQWGSGPRSAVPDSSRPLKPHPGNTSDHGFRRHLCVTLPTYIKRGGWHRLPGRLPNVPHCDAPTLRASPRPKRCLSSPVPLAWPRQADELDARRSTAPPRERTVFRQIDRGSAVNITAHRTDADRIGRGAMPMIRHQPAGARRSSSPSCHAQADRKSNSPGQPPMLILSSQHAVRVRRPTKSVIPKRAGWLAVARCDGRTRNAT